MLNTKLERGGLAAGAPGASIEVAGLSKRFGKHPVLVDVDLHVPAGATVALLGPSGCGKTTLLRTIAGLERADQGEIRIDRRAVAGPGLHVSPEQRRVGMVFQDWALFPHLTVAENVGYGLTRAERASGRVTESLRLVGLEHQADRMPGTLSGGQQQRVALARALAPQPRVLLLDEPFSNLDTGLRVQVRTEVHALLASLGITSVFVTHDQEEAFVLGDRVAVMSAGRIVQHASPAELYTTPVSAWVAQFVGEANLVPGQGIGDRAETAIGAVGLRGECRGDVQVLLRPEQVTLDTGDSATVVLVEFYGHDSMTLVSLDSGELIRTRCPGPSRFVRGDRVSVHPVDLPTVAFAVG
jgi:iron(III) transport system ATP-binding protein